MVVVVVVCLFVDRTICSVRVGVCEDESFLVFPYPPSVVRTVPWGREARLSLPGSHLHPLPGPTSPPPGALPTPPGLPAPSLSPGPVSPRWFLVSPCHPAACYKRSEVALVTHALDILS